MPDILTVGANISTVRIMDPTDFHVKNIVHDWEEHEKREKRYFRIDPDRAKVIIKGNKNENFFHFLIIFSRQI